jgi:hypothetical protein
MTYRPSRDLVPALPARSGRDLYSLNGATTLARELDQWWHSRGFKQVAHTVVALTGGKLPPKAAQP